MLPCGPAAGLTWTVKVGFNGRSEYICCIVGPPEEVVKVSGCQLLGSSCLLPSIDGRAFIGAKDVVVGPVSHESPACRTNHRFAFKISACHCRRDQHESFSKWDGSYPAFRLA